MGNEISPLMGVGQITKLLPTKEEKQQILAKLKKIKRPPSAFYKIIAFNERVQRLTGTLLPSP